ncbi:MAG TPA: DUF5995 family protein, partial [Thermoanaerobaculia bacterium]|nr:DUF5995 family protein [Thermoanaerobaculia bacterium]
MPSPLPPITNINTIDDVVHAIDGIIAWAIAQPSRLGYFAALYKRITIAIRTAVQQGYFQNNPRMEHFDVIFASRYFAALNGWFWPAQFPPASKVWQVAFEGSVLPEPIIVQQMVAGVNAHIILDLGIAAETVAPGAQLPSLQVDFDRVNQVLGSQVNEVLAEIDSLSPALAELYDYFSKWEMQIINDVLKLTRDEAWHFATSLATHPAFEKPILIAMQDGKASVLGHLIYKPPFPLPEVIAAIG